mmetsp:Transcript_116122/g.231542  ORF Transcript_116122/g.231542 Transcript_116122/m.231542 type:complete len:256 (+) Transcript_116122:62-829(+)
MIPTNLPCAQITTASHVGHCLVGGPLARRLCTGWVKLAVGRESHAWERPGLHVALHGLGVHDNQPRLAGGAVQGCEEQHAVVLRGTGLGGGRQDSLRGVPMRPRPLGFALSRRPATAEVVLHYRHGGLVLVVTKPLDTPVEAVLAAMVELVDPHEVGLHGRVADHLGRGETIALQRQKESPHPIDARLGVVVAAVTQSLVEFVLCCKVSAEDIKVGHGQVNDNARLILVGVGLVNVVEPVVYRQRPHDGAAPVQR